MIATGQLPGRTVEGRKCRGSVGNFQVRIILAILPISPCAARLWCGVIEHLEAHPGLVQIETHLRCSP
jgi:hypothetical protein